MPLFNEENQATHFAAIARDITNETYIREQLFFLADHDHLTGIFNRRAFFSRLTIEFQRYQRYQQPYAIILFDLDNFKSCNDQHGHQFGDEVLKSVSSYVQSQLRQSDVFSRYGGEEFTILLLDTTPQEATKTADKIRTYLAEQTIKFNQHNSQVTASFGVSGILPDDVTDQTIIQRADAAMYAAKKQGKNATVLHQDHRPN